MQEEVNQRVVTFSVTTAKLTARVLVKVLRKFLEMEKSLVAKEMKMRNAPAKGKQTLKQLMKQNAGATNIEIDNSNIKSFDRVARKYHIDYAVKKDKTGDPPRYFIFFKARDQDSMTMAFKEYVARNEKRHNREPFKQVLKKYKELSIVKNLDRVLTKTKNRNMEQSL